MRNKGNPGLETSTSVTLKNDETTEVEVFPLSSYSKIQLSSQTVEALVHENPDALFRIVEENQRQQGEAQEQEHQLEMMRLQHAQELAVKAEERKASLEGSNKSLIRFGMIAFIALFSGVLWYSAKVDDKNLPSTIFTAAMSAMAGGGFVLAKDKAQKEQEEKS